MRLSALASAALLLSVPAFSQAAKLAATKPAASTSKTRIITIHEGTNMASTVSPDGKTVILDLQGMLFSLPIEGGKAKQLTRPTDEAAYPGFAPDGKTVVFQSYAGGTFHVWRMNADGTGLKQVTSGHGDDREPRISPDGKTIAFASDRDFKGSYDIWTVGIEGGEPKQITSGSNDEYEPGWTPDGKIVYVSAIDEEMIPGLRVATGRQVIQIDPATLAKKTLVEVKTGRIDSPSVSADGKLAYVYFSGAGQTLFPSKLIVDGKPISSKYDDAFPFEAAWISPTSLLYTTNGKLVKADLSAKTETEIPFTADIKSVRPIFKSKDYRFDSKLPRQALGLYGPALSPDGKQVAFVALNQLYLLTIGNPVPKALTNDSFYKQGPMWSADGKWIAYVSDKDGVENVYLLDPKSGEEKHPSPSKTTAQIFPALSPDGKWFTSQDQTGATHLTEIATGKDSIVAPATFFPGRASFSTNGKTLAIATIHPYTKRFREGTSDILLVDIATKKQTWHKPAPFESVTTRTEDGPVYSPTGKEMAFVMSDVLYTMPVDENGAPAGKAEPLNNEVTDAPTYNGDGSKLLYLNNGKLKLIDRKTKVITPVAVSLKYTPEQPTGSTVIHAGKFWKGSGPDVQTDVDVLVTGNRVVSVTPHGAKPVPARAKVIEAPNSTVLPGLWENHSHPNSDNSIYYGDRMGRLWMAYGITTLRDMADNAYRAVEEKEAFVSGSAVGPRLFATGEAVDGERVYYPMMIATTSEAQLQREFQRLHALDFDFLKLYVRLPYSWMKKGDEFAHNVMGVQTASHYLLPAVAVGNDGMSHVSATARTGWAYSRSLTGFSYSDVQQLEAESGMWTISTLLNQSIIGNWPAMADDSRYNIAPPWEKNRLVNGRNAAVKNPSTASEDRVMREESTVKGVLDRKGLYIGGTDSPLDLPSTSLHLNLRSQVKYGLQPWQALETVTSIAAKAALLDKDLGTLEKGKLADLIIVDGDPLTNINDVTSVQCVMTNGHLRSVAEIAAPFEKLTTGANMCPAK